MELVHQRLPTCCPTCGTCSGVVEDVLGRVLDLAPASVCTIEPRGVGQIHDRTSGQAAGFPA